MNVSGGYDKHHAAQLPDTCACLGELLTSMRISEDGAEDCTALSPSEIASKLLLDSDMGVPGRL